MLYLLSYGHHVQEDSTSLRSRRTRDAGCCCGDSQVRVNTNGTTQPSTAGLLVVVDSRFRGNDGYGMVSVCPHPKRGPV
jgi:hypothetical protein